MNATFNEAINNTIKKEKIYNLKFKFINK